MNRTHSGCSRWYVSWVCELREILTPQLLQVVGDKRTKTKRQGSPCEVHKSSRVVLIGWSTRAQKVMGPSVLVPSVLQEQNSVQHTIKTGCCGKLVWGLNWGSNSDFILQIMSSHWWFTSWGVTVPELDYRMMCLSQVQGAGVTVDTESPGEKASVTARGEKTVIVLLQSRSSFSYW